MEFMKEEVDHGGFLIDRKQFIKSVRCSWYNSDDISDNISGRR